MESSETILAVVACCAMLAAVLMAAFAYRLNEMLDEQSKLMKRMNDDWLDFVKIAIKGEGKK
jgi:hypothetical protein